MELFQYLEYHNLPLLYPAESYSASMDRVVPVMSNVTSHFTFYQCADSDGWSLLSPYYNDVSPCFVQGFLLGGLGLFAVICGSIQLSHLYHKKISVSNRISPFFYVKLMLVAIQIVFQIVMKFNYSGFDLINSVLVLNVLGLVVIFALHYLENFKSNIPNGILLFYWLFSMVFHFLKAINFYVRQSLDSTSGVFTILTVVNSIIILLLEVAVPVKSTLPFDNEKINPYDISNVFSRLTFGWMTGLMKTGYYKFLTEADLPRLPNELKASDTTAKFYENWNNQNTSKPSIVIALTKAFGAKFMLGGIFKGLQDCLAFVQPYLLKLLIQFVNDYTESRKQGDPLPLTKGFMIAGSMFIVSICQTTFLHQYFQTAFDLGMKIKSCLTAVIYNKSMVLSNDAKSQSNTGDIVNLMSVDIQRLQDLVQYVQIAWSGPFQIILCLVSLYKLVGHAMWAGVAIMVIMIPVNSVIARVSKKLQKTQMKNKDERSRLTSEILNNIKSLKFYGWELPYLDKLNHVRNNKELKNLKTICTVNACMIALWNLAPILVSCSTFALFMKVENGRPLSVDIVFPALTLFNMLSFPLAIIPQVISNLIEAQVSLERLHKFLHGDELQTDAIIKLPAATKNGEVAVEVNNGTFLWAKAKADANQKIALSKVNLVAKRGHLDCIVGKVGAGKSSVIQAILGDLYKLEGDVKIHGNIAYVAQVPWIMNGSIKENILFGHKYDPEFYQHVLKACALTVDLGILPKGDQTQVGEKGISLSGGQKARLSLARAVYARSDVYLIDDALSAVDEHVGRHLIDHVLGPNGLLKSRCRILATNNIGVLSIADNLHMVTDGKIAEQGTYDEMMNQPDSRLFALIKEFGKERSKEVEEPSKEAVKVIDGEEPKPVELELESEDDLDANSIRRASVVSMDHRLEDLLDQKDDDDDEELKKRKEHFEQGKVKWDVYLQYAKACNPVNICFWLAGLFLGQSTSVAGGIWLKHWSEVNTGAGYNPQVYYYLGIYLFLGFLSASLLLTQNLICLILCSIRGSKILHNNMAVNVLRAPMSFFETTPIGRILNRFSNDVYRVDETLIRVFSMFFGNSIKVLFSVGVICFSTWQVLLLIIPLLVLYLYYQQYYMRTSRELRRLDSVSRSPIYADFQESLNGVTTIRAYDHSEMFKYMNQLRVDKNMRAYHPAVNANRWLAVRLEFLSAFIILGAAGFSIVSLKSGTLSAGLVGLSVSYSLQITQSLNWIVRMTVEVETNIVSVERILEYSRLKSEAPEVIEDHKPKESWPEHGNIEFKDYSTRYRPELDLVLKNITLSIKAKEKIGIVGRTGAGKSSLTLALFRIIEAVDGNINIDDVNINEIGLRDLRQKLSIIPQDSQVFEGTVRSNLDPFGRFSTEELWKALELSHLKDHVLKMFKEAKEEFDSAEDKTGLTELFDGLDVKLSEGGSNLSVGQRQLMCLARALLIPSHILVLDEATAAVDVETDKVLQETIRKEFKDRTILTIAHRINTILDSDRIIVLEKGEVAEFAAPKELLKNKESLFYSLCKQGGFVE